MVIYPLDMINFENKKILKIFFILLSLILLSFAFGFLIIKYSHGENKSIQIGIDKGEVEITMPQDWNETHIVNTTPGSQKIASEIKDDIGNIIFINFSKYPPISNINMTGGQMERKKFLITNDYQKIGQFQNINTFLSKNPIESQYLPGYFMYNIYTQVDNNNLINSLPIFGYEKYPDEIVVLIGINKSYNKSLVQTKLSEMSRIILSMKVNYEK